MRTCTRVHTQDELRYITYVLDSTKNARGAGVVLFLLQQQTIDFSPQFSQAIHSSTTLGVCIQHPYTAYDKPSVPILIFLPSGYKWLYI